MLLSEIDIVEYMYEEPPNNLIISPITDFQKQIGPSSFDLLLSPHLKVFEISKIPFYELNKDGLVVNKDELNKNFIDIYLEKDEAFTLHPNNFILGSTLEFIKLPNTIAAVIEGRSSISRLGIQVHATAGFVDPGYAGNLTFEMVNIGKVPVKIEAVTRIAQISFHELKSGTSIPYHIKKIKHYFMSFGTVGPK